MTRREKLDRLAENDVSNMDFKALEQYAFDGSYDFYEGLSDADLDVIWDERFGNEDE